MTDIESIREYLSGIPQPSLESAWGKHRHYLRHKLFTEDDWSQFRTWPTVVCALYSRSESPEFQEEKRQCNAKWAKLLNHFDPDNGTVIRQAFTLSLLEEVTGIDAAKVESIIEFGAGYGEMFNYLALAGFKGKYYIYDFPELIALQKYYFSRRRINTSNITWIDSAYKLVTSDWTAMPELSIAVCSLSEAEIPLRQVYVGTIVSPYMIIRYQKKWDGNDNDVWFPEYADYTYDHFAIVEAPLFPKHAYVIGRGLTHYEG